MLKIRSICMRHELPTSLQRRTMVNAEADSESLGKHWVHIESGSKAV